MPKYAKTRREYSENQATEVLLRAICCWAGAPEASAWPPYQMDSTMMLAPQLVLIAILVRKENDVKYLTHSCIC